MPDFNVLTDPWVPLLIEGRVQNASYVDVLSGARGAPDLSSPREDVRFFARMLLSALTQALFPPRDTRELQERIAHPLDRGLVEAKVAEVAADFELVGDEAFLQDATAPDKGNETDRAFLDVPTGTNHLLFRPASDYAALCRPCAVPALYGLHAFAAAGGRGFSPGVRFRPPVTTLVWRPTVRKSIWANVLSAQRREVVGYPADPERAWVLPPRTKSGDAIGLVEGLFWRARRLKLEPSAAPTACAVCGAATHCLEVRRFAPGGKVDGGSFRHPHSPCHDEVTPRGQRQRRFVHFSTHRPAWMGLAELLPIVHGDEKVLAAPVVEQWLEDLGHREVTLQVLSYISAQAKILGRFSETFSLSMQAAGRDVAEDVAFLTERADEVARELQKQLRSATGGVGGLWLGDAEAAFWQATEGAFWSAVEASQRGQDPSAGFLPTLRRAAMRIFDEHTEVACLQETKQQKVAAARARLAATLARLLNTGGTDARAQAV